MTRQKQIAPLAKLNQRLSSPFRAAAPDELVWAREKEFFRVQVSKHWQIKQAVEQGNEATIESVRTAALECAAMGVSMSPHAQLVYFIPRRQRRQFQNESKAEYERKVPWLVTATPSYRGLAYICTHYGGAQIVAAEVVFEADKFKYFGPIKEVEHQPTLDNSKRTESKAIGAYCMIILQSGHVRTEYVDAPTIARVRAKSDNPNGLMWKDFWTEGWRKVPIRRLSKLVMQTEPRMTTAVDVMDKYEGNIIDQDGNDVPRGTSDPEFENVPPADDPRKGMAGLDNALKSAKRAQEIAQESETELAPVDIDPETGEAVQEPPGGPVIHTDGEFAAAMDTKHPAESVEWWAEKLSIASNLDELDAIRAEMLYRGANKSSDADALRDLFKTRSVALKQEVAA